MAHHHHHDHNDLPDDGSLSKIKIAFFINLVFSAIELVGGLYTNSVAIISDALHDLGDSLSLGAAWYFQKLSMKGRDRKFSYGYRRFSVLGALINSIILIVGSTIILSEAIPRLINPQQPDAEGMIYFAIGGIAANGLAAWKLHGGSSINQKAVYLHLLEDVLGWVATLIAAITLYYFDFPRVDPILAMGIATFILYNVVKNLKEAVRIIMQGTPYKVDLKRIHDKLESLEGVKSTHDCHTWTMDGNYNILSIHLVVEPYKSLDDLSDIKQQAKDLLKEEHIDHATIEFETEEEDCEPC
ncbi:cation diffusion facilitator family transporter [Marinoscillum sp.]|uniref:cation diffusion facilitator family transporter n=1 Tax=Marinoscillum sp. TaxID=2024838 RepID=UPI003BA98828